MEITKKLTIHLTEEDVKKIIADYLTKEGYEAEAKDVSLKLGVRYEGYGPGEREIRYFEGCDVNCKPK